MDPTARNEKVSKKPGSVLLSHLTFHFINFSFWLGIALVILNYLVNPDRLSLFLLGIILGSAILRRLDFKYHPFGLTQDRFTKKFLPFSIIILNDQLGNRTAFTVSDEVGRYFLLVPRGKYELSVHTSSAVTSPGSLVREISTRSGWISKTLNI